MLTHFAIAVDSANTRNIGVSLLTQVLYAFVFLTRYLDLFRGSIWTSDHAYNLFFKLFYIFSSIYIIVVMIYFFPRTREREKSWKLASWCVLGAVVGAPTVLGLYAAALKESYPRHWFTEVLLLRQQCQFLQIRSGNSFTNSYGCRHAGLSRLFSNLSVSCRNSSYYARQPCRR